MLHYSGIPQIAKVDSGVEGCGQGKMKVHPDFNDFIKTLRKNNVDFVIVGAFALAFHGHPRATGDLDVWVRPEEVNVHAVLKSLSNFGFQGLTICKEDILSGKIIQLGFPPVRIDIITVLDGLDTEEIWKGRQPGKLGKHHVYYIGKEAFIKNKRAIGRHKDLADIELLGEKV